MKTEKNNEIMVFYIDVRMVEPEEISKLMEKIKKSIIPKNFLGEIILIPIYGETKVECINPKYITDSDLIKKHERLIAELHEHLNNQINGGK